MKKLLVLFCITSSIAANAQLKEGKVVYERTIQIQNRFRGGDNEAIARRLPTSRTDNFELLFTKTHSLWQSLPDANTEASTMTSGDGPGRMQVMRFGGIDDVVYYNFEAGKRIDQRELGDKNFIIEDSIRRLSWKLTDETKTILGYTARKATSQRVGSRMQMGMENGEMKRREVPDTAYISAWFTTDIPVPAGPEFGGQLPGLILELDMNNGRTVYKAVEISPKVKVDIIKEPKKGKRMTAAEFRKETDKYMEEMRNNIQRNGGNIRIQTNQ
ncbi:MAG: GLPGLI family protein [Chitinophagaceae bacterium]